MAGIVIIGASHSGVAAAAALRSANSDEAITLVTQETILPYHRPPLSKEALSTSDFNPTPLRPPLFYSNNRIDLRQGVRILGIDPGQKRLTPAEGNPIAYDTLILASGAEPRRLPARIDPGNLAHYLRTHDDLLRLKSRLVGARSVAIIGGGLIGVEIAAMAVQNGLQVTVIEAGSRLMERTVSKSIASYVLDRHQAKGLKARFNTVVASIHRDPGRGVDIVTLQGGETVEADLVVAAIGAVPHDELARAAGLKVDNGILASQEGVTTDPSIYAIGDCAAWYDPLLGRHVRNEAVNPGQDQAKAVAAAIVRAEQPPRRLPRYWSHQAGIQIQMAGPVNGTDMEAVLNAPASGAFSVLGFKDGRLAAVQSINAAQPFGKLMDMIGMDREALAIALDVEFPPPHHH